MTARELEQRLIRQFGRDFRDKTIVTAFGSFNLGDAFDECGLEDPGAERPAPSGAYGLWQWS